jgi:hypothetical protein
MKTATMRAHGATLPFRFLESGLLPNIKGDKIYANPL